jgi:uncharacterized protein (TIGR02246 family)
MVDSPTGENVEHGELRELLDREAIRAVVTRYFRGVDRGDVKLVASVFHADAVEVRGRHELSGPGMAEAMVASVLEHMVGSSHHVTSQTIELDRDTAGCETYCLGIHLQDRDGVTFRVKSASRYLDRFERRDGEWRVVQREVLLEMLHASPLDEEERFGRPQSRRDRDDPSYRFLGS